MEKKMKNNNPLNGIALVVIFSLFLLPAKLFSRINDNQDVAELMASKLKQKVILSDEQTAKVKIILDNYIKELKNNENSSENLEKAKNDVESLLNEKQKAKYDIIKDDFFDEVSRKVLNKS